jgi:hypothetical protein
MPSPDANNYNTDLNSASASACAMACKADSRCLSIGTYLNTDPVSGAMTRLCRYFDKSVTESADLGPGFYTFSDKACPA